MAQIDIVSKLVELQRKIDHTSLIMGMTDELKGYFSEAGFHVGEEVRHSDEARFTATIRYRVEESTFVLTLKVIIGKPSTFEMQEGEVDQRFKLIVDTVVGKYSPSYRLVKNRLNFTVEILNQAQILSDAYPILIEMRHHFEED